MANHDPHHSSHERTILWVIAPAAVAVCLLFTRLNHHAPTHRTILDGKVDVASAEKSTIASDVDVNVHLVKEETVVKLDTNSTEHAPEIAPVHH